MAWLYLFIAAGFEMVWAVGLKYTDGFTRALPSAITLTGLAFSMYFLSLALRTIPIGTAYAIWTGIGAAGVAVAGMILFNEPRDVIRFLSLGLIIIGIAGLKFSLIQQA